jgi:hypothetical protein
MVFFTSILIVVIFYYLQDRGLIFIAAIAVAAELINRFMTRTMVQAAEKKTAVKFSKIVQEYKTKITSQKKTIKGLEHIQEESVKKIYAANKKIKQYEEQLGLPQSQLPSEIEDTEINKIKALQKQEPEKNKPESPKNFADTLPDGSNRKKLPI